LLGEALVRAAPTEPAAIAVGRDLARGLHFARLPERVAGLYIHAAYADVVTASGVRVANLRRAMIWTEALREARNAIHHGTAAPVLLWNVRAATIR
jgi:hypothetical protein